MSARSGHEKSTSPAHPGTLIHAFTRGRGSPARPQSAKNRCSSQLRVHSNSTACARSAPRSADEPARPCPKSRSTSARSKAPRLSAAAMAPSSSSGWTAAIPISVRAMLAQGIASTTARSASPRSAAVKVRIPMRLRACRGVVISISRGGHRSISPWSAPEQRCESTAPGPDASTAAIQRPRSVSLRCPTANTPR
jgi:hypothetical protein